MREATQARGGQAEREAARPSRAHNGNGGSRLIDAIALHARTRPDAPAVSEAGDGGACCTYGELAAMVTAKTKQLRAIVGRGSVVVAVVPSGVEYASWFCAAIAAGTRFLPLHTQIAGPEALSVVERAGAAAVIGGGGGGAWGLASGCVLIDRTTSGVPHPATSIDVCTQLQYAAAETASYGAVVLGSSGTTGLPKLALRESASLDADADGVIAGTGLTEHDRVLAATPLSHSYGVDLLVGTLTAGASLRVVAQFDAELVAAELTGGVTVLPGVPFIFEALARCEPRKRGSLRLALSAGSPLPQRVREGFQAAWGLEVGQLYGATELGTVSMDVPGSSGFDAASVGRPLPGVSMRVVDVDDPSRPLGAGEEGQLVVRAASMLSGYLDGDVPLVDGHMLTGDLARMGTDGRVRITGRMKLLIDVGAYKVNPLEVEGVLSTHPGVAECVVVPVAASETVQRMRAVAVARDPAHPPTAESLRGFLRERLSPIKVPRVVEIVASLPKSPTGKVLRDRV